MEDPYTSIADLFLLERWQEDSPLSPEAQREQIFAEFMTLGVDGQQPYKDQLRQRGHWSNLTPEERGILDRVRQPAVPERICETPWLRTCYEPSTEAAFSRIVERLENQWAGQVIVLNDPALYNFGTDWHKIFLRFPEFLVYPGSAEEYHEELQEALREESDLDEEEGEDNIQYEDENDYLCYYWALVAGRMNIVDKMTLASEGRNAGKVRIVWHDACGRLVRSYRAEVGEASNYTGLNDAFLKDHAIWLKGTVGRDFKWGAPLGPPYDHSSGDSEGGADENE